MPEDRKSEGLVHAHSVLTNMTLTALRRFITALGLIAHQREDKVVADYIKAFTIRTPGADAVVATLSGGKTSKVKVLLAKALMTEPKGPHSRRCRRGASTSASAARSTASSTISKPRASLSCSSDMIELNSASPTASSSSHEAVLTGALFFGRGEATQDAIMQRAVA